VGHLGAESADVSYIYYLRTLMNENGIVLFLLSAYGIYKLVKENFNKAVIFLAFPVIYFLFIGGFRVHFPRNITVLMPFAALLSGYAANELLKIIPHIYKGKKYVSQLLSGVLILIVFFMPVSNSFSYWQRINMTDTTLLAKYWIEENLPADARILQESSTAALSDKFTNRKLEGLIGKYTESLNAFEYVIVSSRNYERIFKDESRRDLRKNYEKIFSEFKLIKEFKADDENYIGPTVKIYKNPLH
jgi:hypothetical protein